MTTKEVLTAARALIADEKHFAQRAYARTAENYSTSWDAADAVCFCALGACHKVRNRFDIDNEAALLSEAAGKVIEERGQGKGIWPFVVHVNDLLGHDATLRMFDLAIEAAQ